MCGRNVIIQGLTVQFVELNINSVCIIDCMIFTKKLIKNWSKIPHYLPTHNFATGPSFQVSNPLTALPSVQYQNSDTNQDMQNQIQSLSSKLIAWNQLSISNKKQHIANFIRSLQEKKQQIAQIMHSSTGKSMKECREELELSIAMLEVDIGGEYPMEVVKSNGSKYIMQAFNNILIVYDHRTPALSTLKYLVQSAIGGAGMILNPQRYALPTSKALQILWRNTVPEHPIIYCPINLFTDGLQYLIQHEHTGFVSFSGDIEPGNIFYHFMASKSQIFAESEFLLTSNDAAYVSKSLSEQNLNKCVQNLVKGCFSGAGNLIDSIKRIFVDQQIQELFISKFLQASKIYNIDTPEHSQISPIVTSRHIKQAKELIQELQNYKKEDLKLLTEINSLQQGKCLKLSPIIYKVQGIPDIEYWTKIYPMPIVFISSVSSAQECVQKINETTYGNTACIFTDDMNDIQKIGNDLQVGTVNINRWGFTTGVPYAARKRSGKGSSFSQYSFNNILRSKSVNSSHS